MLLPIQLRVKPLTKNAKNTLPVDVRRTKTSLLKLPSALSALIGNAAAFNEVNRGYYMAARGNEFYLRVLKVSLTSERSEQVRDTFTTRR